MTWSRKEVDIGIQSLLIQFYPVLLSTLLSIDRQQLSLADAHFALLISSSPLTVYLVAASIGDIVGIQTGLYKQIKSHRLITRTLGALVPLLWLALSMTLTFSKSAFKDSSCAGGGFTDWLSSAFFSIVVASPHSGAMGYFKFFLIAPATFAIPFLACLARRWSQIKAEVRLSSIGTSNWRKPWAFLICMWCVPVVSA